MTSEERTNAIGMLLRETIMPRYHRPEHLDDDTARAELRDMVADLNAEWPLMSADRFSEVCEGLARAIRVTHGSRQWPTIAAMCKALKRALEPKALAPGDDAGAAEAIYGMVLEWWQRFKRPLPSTAKADHAIRLQREGHATWGQLRRTGFDIPDFAREEALSELDPNHDAIMAELAAIGSRLRATQAPKGSPRGRHQETVSKLHLSGIHPSEEVG